VNFMVVWRQIAEDELAEIWIASTNRNAVTAAAHAIDQALAIDADAVGRPVFDTVREYIHPPLGVEFEVIVADARVWVLKVWDTAHGRPAPSGH
jgi:hypothetical protein